MGFKPSLARASDMDLFRELYRRKYFLMQHENKRWRDEAATAISSCGETRPARVLELYCPESSPLWWPKEGVEGGAVD